MHVLERLQSRVLLSRPYQAQTYSCQLNYNFPANLVSSNLGNKICAILFLVEHAGNESRAEENTRAKRESVPSVPAFVIAQYEAGAGDTVYRQVQLVRTKSGLNPYDSAICGTARLGKILAHEIKTNCTGTNLTKQSEIRFKFHDILMNK